MRILITGDIHNNFARLNELINRRNADLIICCGDFGYWPDVTWAEPFSNIKLQRTKKLLWCDGNHENHWALIARQTDELAPGIIYMPRGSTYQLEDGRNIMFMGGAHSIDQEMRTVGIDWFPEETIRHSDIHGLPDIKIDIFITHTCPTELLIDLLPWDRRKTPEPSNYALTALWKEYMPSLWFFGHWHKYYTGMLNHTKWYALSAPGFGDKWWMWLPEKE